MNIKLFQSYFDTHARIMGTCQGAGEYEGGDSLGEMVRQGKIGLRKEV